MVGVAMLIQWGYVGRPLPCAVPYRWMWHACGDVACCQWDLLFGKMAVVYPWEHLSQKM